jgi:lipoprotein-anchoring transpeptidase ErfK/SrfK
MPNGRLAWVDSASDSVAYRSSALTLEADLSARRLRVEIGARVVRSFPVAVGRPGSPTPIGRFAVTDKLRGSAYGSYFGCCILALSAHQPNLPTGWRGGDRLAIHGSPVADEGTASSAGCLHASERALRYLMRVVPLGTQITIHP